MPGVGAWVPLGNTGNQSFWSWQILSVHMCLLGHDLKNLVSPCMDVVKSLSMLPPSMPVFFRESTIDLDWLSPTRKWQVRWQMMNRAILELCDLEMPPKGISKFMLVGHSESQVSNCQWHALVEKFFFFPETVSLAKMSQLAFQPSGYVD